MSTEAKVEETKVENGVTPEDDGKSRGPIKSIPYVGKQADFTKEDSLPKVQFTSFEKKKDKDKEAEKEGGGSKYQETQPIPEAITTSTFTVDKDKIETFQGRQSFLSNFYRSSTRIDGNVYPSVEHYYQACKLYMLAGPRFSNQVRRIGDSGQVKVTAKRLLRGYVSEKQIEEWKMVEGPRLLEYGMTHKFAQNPELRIKLLETGDKLLVHLYDKDPIFANNLDKEKWEEWLSENDGKTLTFPQQLTQETVPFFPIIGNGKNLLGLIAMRVRDQIRRHAETLVKAEDRDKGDEGLVDALKALDLKDKEKKKEEGKVEEVKKEDKKKKDGRYLE